jgi:hypothetical protein
MRKAAVAFATGRFVRAVAKNRRRRFVGSPTFANSAQSQQPLSSGFDKFLRVVRNRPTREKPTQGVLPSGLYAWILLGFILIGTVESVKLWLGY